MTFNDHILKWLLTGETGISSKTMAAYMAGITKGLCDKNHPLDPADLNRCIKFLDAVPESRKHIDKVRKASKQWAVVVDNWELLEKTFIEEAGYNWSKSHQAPKTYELMKSLGC